jgi:hypothetical protein
MLATTPWAAGSPSCATGSWPAGTRFISVPPPASARVSFAGGRWRLWLRPATRRALTGRIVADAGLSSVQATGGLRSRVSRTVRALSFLLPAGADPARLSFAARCAGRVSFDLAGARVLIGRQPAPTSAFQIQRPATSGVAGRLIAGPTCPVVGPGVNCPPSPAVQGTVQISTAPATRSSSAGAPVATVSSDSNGNFSADLPPGQYMLTGRASGPQPPAGTISRTASVLVESGVVSQVTVVFDTGIR